jgi:hypothetical protein
VSAAAPPPPAFPGALGPARRVAPQDVTPALGPREAALRSAATACLAGMALTLGIELAPVVARSAVVGAVVLGGMALCVGAGLALVAATARASAAAWRAVAGTATLVLAAWALPHAATLPPPAGARGDWAATPGVACAGLAAVCLVLAALAVRPTRATIRGLAAALLVVVAWMPAAAAFVVATGPGPPGGEAAIATGAQNGHLHVHATASEPVVLRRPGRNGDHFVTLVPRPHRPPAAGVALLTGAAAVFVAGAATSLRRRAAGS